MHDNYQVTKMFISIVEIHHIHHKVQVDIIMTLVGLTYQICGFDVLEHYSNI